MQSRDVNVCHDCRLHKALCYVPCAALVVKLAMHAQMLWYERHNLFKGAILGLCGRWDSADMSMGQYQPQQQQQQQHASKAPGVFTQLPPPQQLSGNGAAHMQGIFSHSAPRLPYKQLLCSVIAPAVLSFCACSALTRPAYLTV